MNYLITGVSRTGKSTLAKKLYTTLNRHTHNFSLIPFDPFIDSWKQKEIMNPNSLEEWKELEFSPTCRNMIEYAIQKLSKIQYLEQNFIFESAHVSYDPGHFEILLKKYKIENLNIIYLLHDTSLTNDMLLKKVREHDSEVDWTYKKDSKELSYKFECALHYNNLVAEYFKKVDHIHFITTKNRIQTFESIVKTIEKNNYHSKIEHLHFCKLQ